MKKNRINLKLKATSLAISLLSVFLFAVLSGTLLIKEASAIDYTSYSGTLEGADWALRIPDPWNGMLVMVCRGYSGSSLPSPFSTLGNVVASDILNQGFAVAASNYGTTGLCIPEGVNSTYQLTMHVIDNYNVTGRVFLLGMSMGGAIVLLLGEKYPEVYSGVLDDFGVKDMADLYTISKKWSNLTDEDLTAELTALNINRIPPDFFSTLDQFRNFLEMASNDTEIAMGGTPETHLQAYQDVSPTSHANITIPVITVHGTDDGMVPYYQSLMYQNAVADAGCSDMYRLVAVPGGGHGGLFGVSSETIVHFSELVEWSNYLTGVYDWPMFGHDPQNVGYTESPAPSTNQTLWTTTFSLGGGVSPVIAEDKLYFGAWNNKVYCLNYSTGAEIWNYTTGDPILCTAAVADGKVYVGSIDDNLYCLNASSGAKIWNFTGDGWGFRGAPTVVDGKVYAGSDDTNIYCLNATTGAKIWNYTTGDVLITFPAVADGKVYAGSNDTNVYCLDTLTGAKIWNYTTGDHVLSGPTIADGKVYVGSADTNVYCLNATYGTLIWSCETSGVSYHGPAIANGVVYVLGGNQVYAFSDLDTFIPESFTIAIVVLLSTVAIILSFWLLRKQPKWKNMLLEKP